MATTSTLAAVESKKQAQEHKSAESKIPRLNKLAGFVTYWSRRKNVGFEPSQVLSVRETRVSRGADRHNTSVKKQQFWPYDIYVGHRVEDVSTEVRMLTS